jgi:hypothetical protein
VRVTPITAFVAPADIVDHGVRPLMFYLEGGDQGILGRYHQALPLTPDVYSDSEFYHVPLPAPPGPLAKNLSGCLLSYRYGEEEELA